MGTCDQSVGRIQKDFTHNVLGTEPSSTEGAQLLGYSRHYCSLIIVINWMVETGA